MRTIKTTKLPDADKVAVPQSGNGKPQWTAPAVPRDGGGMSVGKTGGNFADVSLERPNSTPAELLDKEGTGNP